MEKPLLFATMLFGGPAERIIPFHRDKAFFIFYIRQFCFIVAFAEKRLLIHIQIKISLEPIHSLEIMK